MNSKGFSDEVPLRKRIEAAPAGARPHPPLLPGSRRRSWLEFEDRFPGARECLASYLALETAEVLAGAKPANLIRIQNRTQRCGHNLYRLWQAHGEQLLAGSALAVRTMRDHGDGILLLFFRPELLAACLTGRRSAALLRRFGYGERPELATALAILRRRFEQEQIPHEVGVFLGYPLKDVAGFLGWSDRPCRGQQGWKIFGDPRPSLERAERFAACRRRMAARLAAISDPVPLLAPAA